ncbi:unnamed protein product [Arctogadus glacialis]
MSAVFDQKTLKVSFHRSTRASSSEAGSKQGQYQCQQSPKQPPAKKRSAVPAVVPQRRSLRSPARSRRDPAGPEPRPPVATPARRREENNRKGPQPQGENPLEGKVEEEQQTQRQEAKVVKRAEKAPQPPRPKKTPVKKTTTTATKMPSVQIKLEPEEMECTVSGAPQQGGEGGRGKGPPPQRSNQERALVTTVLSGAWADRKFAGK